MAGVGRSFLYEEVKAGHLVLTKAGRRSIVLHDDAVAWLTHLPKRAPASTPPGGRRSVSWQTSATTLTTPLEHRHLDFSRLATSPTFSTSPPAAFGGGSSQVISQSIGSEALCAFQTAIFGRLPQRIGRDDDTNSASWLVT